MAAFTCDIITPVQKVVSAEASFVAVFGVEGEMGFLRGHAPLVSVLADGVARVTDASDGEIKRYALQGGYVEVADKKVTILTDRALVAGDIDVAHVRKQLDDIEAQLETLSQADIDKTTLPADKSWCKVQLKAAQAL